MPYPKTQWQDHIVDEQGNLIQQGTPVSAANMNKIENQLELLTNNQEEPLYQTITSEGESVISLPESTIDKGQVSDIKLSGRTYSNEVKNGNFEDTTGWTGTGVGASISVNNNILSATANGTIATPNVLGGNNGQKYQANTKIYASCIVKVPEGCTSILFNHRDTTSGIYQTIDSIGSPTAGAIIKLEGLYTLSIDSDYPRWQVVFEFPDTTTANGKVLELQKVLAVNLTALGDTETDVDVLSQKYHFVDGTKSTVSSIRLMGTNKNQWRKGLVEYGAVAGYGADGKWNYDDTIILDGQYQSVSNTLKVIPNTEYTLSLESEIAAGTVKLAIDNTYITQWTTNERRNFNFTSNNQGIVKIDFYTATDPANIKIKNIMLALASVDQAYIEPITDNKCYIYAEDENGNIIKLNAIYDSNGNLVVKDEVIEENGNYKVKKNTWEVILDGSLSWVFDTDYTGYKRVRLGLSDSYGGHYPTCIKDDNIKLKDGSTATGNSWSSADSCYVGSDNNLYITISDAESGWAEDYTPTQTDIQTYFTNHPYTLIYQLAEPKYYYLNTTPLTAYSNGTVYFEKVVPEVSFYDSVNGCVVTHSDYPISSIDFIRKVNQADGSHIELDVSQATIAGDGLSFTHPDLTDGDLVDWDYFYAEELSTYPSSSLTVDTNAKAQINSNSEATRQLSKIVQNQETRIEGNRLNIEELQQPTTLLEKIKEVDGDGSGLDADTLKGLDVDTDDNGTAQEIAKYNSNGRVYDSERIGGKTLSQIPGYDVMRDADGIVQYEDTPVYDFGPSLQTETGLSGEWVDVGSSFNLDVSSANVFLISVHLYNGDDGAQRRVDFKLRDTSTSTETPVIQLDDVPIQGYKWGSIGVNFNILGLTGARTLQPMCRIFTTTSDPVGYDEIEIYPNKVEVVSL